MYSSLGRSGLTVPAFADWDSAAENLLQSVPLTQGDKLLAFTLL